MPEFRTLPVQGRSKGSRKSIAFQPTSSMEGSRLVKETLGTVDEEKENAGLTSGRKTRSKSLGPGELQASIEAKDELAKNAPRSILQPALPISPLQQIPLFHPARNAVPAPVMVPLKSEQEQQAEKVRREAERTSALNHRANRRKSLGNRRVSFNPEVTMHLLESAKTPSTGGTQGAQTPANHNARAAAAATPTPATIPEREERPTTPPEQLEDEIPLPDPARLVHKKENRKPPATPRLDFNNPDDYTSGSSPTPSSAFSSSPGIPDDAESVLAPDNSSDEDDDDVLSVVSPSVTARTGASSDADSDSDESMDLADDSEVTGAFQPWMKKTHDHPRLSHPETGFTSAPPRPQDANANMPWSGPTHDHPRLSHPETGFRSAPTAAPIMQQIGEDDMTMDITRAIGHGIMASPTPTSKSDGDDMTMDMIRVVGPGLLQSPADSASSENGEQTMDMTRAIGGVLPPTSQSSWHDLRPVSVTDMFNNIDENRDDGEDDMEITKVIGPGVLQENALDDSTSPSVRRLSRTRARESMQSSLAGDDETMDITRAIGGIKRLSQDSYNNDEEMTMDLTKVIGGVLGRPLNTVQTDEIQSADVGMEVTTVIGGILSTVPEDVDTDSSDDPMDIDMEVTQAIGGILKKDTDLAPPETPNKADKDMFDDNKTMPARESIELPNQDTPSRLPLKSPRSAKSTILVTATELGSPTPTRAQKKGSIHRLSTNFASSPLKNKASEPFKENAEEPAGTPTRRTRSQSKHSTPQPGTPVKSPLPAVSHGLSGKRRVAKAKSVTSTPKADAAEHVTYTLPIEAQVHEQGVVGVAHGMSAKRRVADQASVIASPHKTSSSAVFYATTPTKQTTEDDTILSAVGHGLSAKRRIAGKPATTPRSASKLHSNSSPRKITGVGITKPGMGSPAIRDILNRRKSLGEDMDANESFSPGVKPLSDVFKQIAQDKLDEKQFQEENVEEGKSSEPESLKQLINRMTPSKPIQTREVTSIKAGPSKRLFTEMKQQSESIPGTSSNTSSPVRKKKRPSLENDEPVKPRVAFANMTNILHHENDRNDEAGNVVKKATDQKDVPSLDSNQADESQLSEAEILPNITVKEFLSMIDISFQDALEPTKQRRQTGMYKPLQTAQPSLKEDEEADLSDILKSVLVIRPNLDLYQHSCREVREHFRAGRELNSKVEAEVRLENPPLFREYRVSGPEVRREMTKQFQGIKEYARYQAKEKWYSWRMILMPTLKEGAMKNLLPLKMDAKIIEERKSLIESCLPVLEKNHAALEKEVKVLRTRKAEIDACDPQELERTRLQLDAVLKNIEQKQKEVVSLEQSSEELDKSLSTREEKKTQLLQEIEEAEKVKAANKGFSIEEVLKLKANVENLEKKYGWSIESIKDKTVLTMVYKKDLQITFDVGKLNGSTTFVLVNPTATTTQHNFFLQQLSASVQSNTFASPRKLLRYVQDTWDTYLGIIDQIKRLEIHFPLNITVKEEGLVVRAVMLVRERKAKVNVDFSVTGTSADGGKVKVDVKCQTVYGEQMKGWKMDEYIQKMLEEDGEWKEAVMRLRQQLAA